MKSNDKPSLDDLFKSKKFDVPSDEFWDGFQDSVHDRALSSVIRPKTFTLNLKSVLIIPSSLALLLAIAFVLRPAQITSSTHPSVALSEVEVEIDHALPVSSSEIYSEVLSKESIDPSFADQSFYVYNSLEWVDEDSSFENHTIEEKEIQQLNLFAQFTF
jgi:hypothetical protein